MRKLNIRIKEVDGKSPHYMSGYAVKDRPTSLDSVRQNLDLQVPCVVAGCNIMMRIIQSLPCFSVPIKKASITLSALSQRRLWLLIFHSY